jgi:hypothetical protein
VQCVNLADDELWRAIADNTNAMSTLVERLVLDEGITASDPDRRAELTRGHLQTTDRYQREYRDYTAELRRRYP